jgi:hypothetical protein
MVTGACVTFAALALVWNLDGRAPRGQNKRSGGEGGQARRKTCRLRMSARIAITAAPRIGENTGSRAAPG